MGQFYEFAMQKIDTYNFDCDCSYNIYVPLAKIKYVPTFGLGPVLVFLYLASNR